ncbi:SDR family oxidoreductase [Kribbella sp. NPDC026611]|uniref:SDR family NAD(P)-dependent oxidoreductase n=1 Tax=Kribbella sp. NPDC026611 TaxID=3154911 RepID=UPI003403F126
MELHLSGKVAVVTGASKGIGLAITRSLAEEGAVVVAGALHGSEELDLLADRFPVQVVKVDLTEAGGPQYLIDEAVARHGVLDVLVNNVGAVRPRLDGFLAITDDDWDATLTINFLAAVRSIRAALPHLMGRPNPSIVTISSVNARLPDPPVVDYSAAKGALSNLCKSLSKEFGPRGVRINTISPGPVQTDLWLGADGVAQTIARAQGVKPEDVAAGAAADSPTGRFTTPQEVADIVLLLAGERAGNVNGSDFVIDGGLITTV